MSIYYLGFQRAPPKQACVNGSICISPTILNDLREAVYSPQTDEVVRINIAWVIDEKELIKKLSVAATIVWQGVQTSYKQLQVSVPSRSAIYRLALWVETTSKLGRERSLSIRRLHHVMELEAFHSLQNQSTIFLPALSDAIKVSDAKDTQVNPSKSSHISRVFCTCQNRTFMIKEESGFELDKVRNLLLLSYVSVELISYHLVTAPLGCIANFDLMSRAANTKSSRRRYIAVSSERKQVFALGRAR